MRKKITVQDPVFAGNYEYIPEGIYQASAIRHELSGYYGRRVLYLWFQVVDGPHMGKRIFMHFNFPKKMTRSSKYFKAWCVANNQFKPRRNDRLSPRTFSNKVFSVKVRTVSKSTNYEPYSVVDELLGVSVG